jgi:hypothetical protein
MLAIAEPRAGDHQRDDQAHLDDCHRHREEQRAERFADPVGHHLGVVHGGQHGTDQHDRDQARKERRRFAPPRDAQNQQRDDGRTVVQDSRAARPRVAMPSR